MLSLLPGLTTDPYVKQERVGLQDDIAYAEMTDAKARVEEAVNALFNRLERDGRAQLIRVEYPIYPKASGSALHVLITWKDLEDNKVDYGQAKLGG